MTTPVHKRTAGAAAPPARPAQRPLRAVSTGPEFDRDLQRQHFEMDLRQRTNRRGHPFAERAIGAYRDAVISLDKYLAEIGFAGDFTAVDTGTLNGYFAAYRQAHGQGGTVTKQGNLRQFFAYLAEEYEIADPYADRQLVRYRRAEEPPPVMGAEVVATLLATARTKGYEDVRDTAIIRLMCTGMRREEIAQLRVGDLDLDRRIVWTVGLKGRPGRPVPFGNRTGVALARWLRVRATNRYSAGAGDRLWLGTRNRAGMTGNGIYQMLRRRTTAAGLPPGSVRPHLFRHTAAHEWLADGGSEGDLMQIMGWKDRSMVDRYGASMAQARALADAHIRALDDRY